ncbi:uncharacterized protein PODANS_3_5620 [Podospora anserina S mat+]|uniref:Podospora anserina S mat+ genomic DNA chromosome 3, supercontig 2 n=1 Tax=Podospora anserina (strain S / ATCC MYA-4624 / DSM 980 / FGSC 10383) TaxID=515849 RepID=B2B0G9_PODAN|nr:uncharacterized protein PODANS_3_5620 [Podospora anserina S mat+]CAP70491.1 unnamed protein product [Podospora anserina S mat+]CDP27080.1 Putative protein of unknown function [Podospora anserina S mat+]
MDEGRPNARYATHSHYWGDLRVLALTTDTFDSFRQQAPPEALSKTYRHAIEITHYFGIEYLWVDSLCIFQDSTSDWTRESALMAEVFERSPRWRCQTMSSDGRHLLNICRVEKFGQHRWHIRNKLAGTAWVVQERYLSSRTLHFTNDGVYWECDQGPASEVSQASLSFDKDRLIAISGLAKHIVSTTNDQFLAGLWKENFIKDVFWSLRE